MPQTAKPETAEPQVSASAPAKYKGKVLLIVLLVAVLVVAIAAIVFVALVMVNKKGTGGNASRESPIPPPVVVSAPVVPHVSAIDLNKPPVFVQLEPFTVNLRAGEEGDNHYLQTDISLRVNDQKTAEALKGWMPEIRNRVNLILSSKSIFDIQEDFSHERIQNEILRGLNTLFGVPPPPPEVPQGQAPLGPIQGVLFVSFIVQ
ncbi:MAG: flagellar basal body-associated FliL family protein [Betaproteobacteria bacterium]|nr:flagellar basal body-associated FliL family protein [Betaproteobacteria bacterium]